MRTAKNNKSLDSKGSNRKRKITYLPATPNMVLSSHENELLEGEKVHVKHDKIPELQGIIEKLNALTDKEITALAASSGVGVSTLQRIRKRQTPNPGIETVRKFLPYLEA